MTVASQEESEDVNGITEDNGGNKVISSGLSASPPVPAFKFPPPPH